MIYLFGANSISQAIAEELEKSGTEFLILIDQRYSSGVSFEASSKLVYTERVSFNIGDRLINCLGYRNLQNREAITQRYKNLGVLSSYISPDASTCKSSVISLGAVILSGASIERGATIEEGAIIWGGARVCHDALVGNHSFVAAGAIIGGYSKIPPYSKIGFNSVIEDHADLSSQPPLAPGALAYVKSTGEIFRAGGTSND